MRRSSIEGILEYLLILLIILDTNSIYSASVEMDYHIPEITAIVLVILMVYRCSRPFNRININRLGIFMIVYYPYIILYGLASVRGEQTLSFVARFVIVLPSLIVYFCMQTQLEYVKPFQKYINVMTALASISLLFWVFGSQMHLISPTNDMIINWGVHKAYHCYYGLYAERQYVTFLSYTGLRNQGIFCEGPMHSLCLTIAIAMEIFVVQPFYRDKDHTIHSRGHVGTKFFRRQMNGKLLILIATLISTFTTTGQIIIIVMLILRIMLGSSQHRFNKLMKLFVVVLFAILGMYVATSILLMKATSESWLIRMNGYRTGFQTWLKAPLFGTGFNDYTVFRTLSSNFGASNSITLILAQGGIIFLMIYLIPVIFAGWLAIKNRDHSMLSFLLVFICEFTVTAFSYEFLMLFLLSYFYSSFIRINVHPSSIPKLQRE